MLKIMNHIKNLDDSFWSQLYPPISFRTLENTAQILVQDYVCNISVCEKILEHTTAITMNCLIFSHDSFFQTNNKRKKGKKKKKTIATDRFLSICISLFSEIYIKLTII